MRKNRNIRELLDKRIPDGKRLLIKAVREEAGKAGKVFLAGGFVRDLLLGLQVSDIDLTVEGDANALARSIESRFRGKLVCHERFKTATVFFKQGSRLDISTAREEKYPRPAALPEVVSSSIYSDLRRRDFTVNAMAVSLNTSSYGELIDCFGGTKDLENKTIRAIHPDSFRDDPTRVFRAIRFSHRLGFKIEKNTAAMISAAVSGRFCDMLSGRRLRNEIELLFSEDDPAGAAARMLELGIQECITPGIKAGRRKIDFIRDFDGFIEYAGREKFPGDFKFWLARFMALLLGMDSEALSLLTGRLMLGKQETRAVVSLPRAETVSRGLYSVENPPPSEVYFKLRPFPPEAGLLAAFAAGKKRRYEIVKKFNAARSVRTGVTGSDLVRMGFKPGPGVREALDEIRRKKIDGCLKTRTDEVNFIKQKKFKGAD